MTLSVCLINPPRQITKNNIWSHVKSSLPHLGLLNLAAVLEKENIHASIVDFSAGPCPDSRSLLKTIKSWSYNYYGITATTPSAYSAYNLSHLIKQYHPHAKIIIGGVHATALPYEPFLKGAADYVIRGDGELALLSLLKGDPLEKIQGLSYKNGLGVHHAGINGHIADLDSLPMPAYHKISLNQYQPAVGSFKRKPVINMNTSRGCPGQCTFCNSANIPLRRKSANRILEEILLLQKIHHVKEISFYDDTFTVYPATVFELCEKMISNNLNLSWSCFARADCVNEKMLRLMKRAGCHQIMYGVESKNNHILNAIHKNINHEHNERAITLTKKLRITTRCAFMLGNPGETEETIDDTIQYAIRLNPDIAVFNITTPFPGTAMFEAAKANNLLLTENWDDYDLGKPTMRLDGISSNTLIDKYHKAYASFYLRPGSLLKRFFNIRLWAPSSMIAGVTTLPFLLFRNCKKRGHK